MKQSIEWTRRIAEHPLFPFLGGVLAFLVTLSCLVAFVPILCLLVVINRRRWPSLVMLSALGSAAGAALLTCLLGRYGYPVVSEYLPQRIGTRHWHGAVRWLRFRYKSKYFRLFLQFALKRRPKPLLLGKSKKRKCFTDP